MGWVPCAGTSEVLGVVGGLPSLGLLTDDGLGWEDTAGVVVSDAITIGGVLTCAEVVKGGVPIGVTLVGGRTCGTAELVSGATVGGFTSVGMPTEVGLGQFEGTVGFGSRVLAPR